MSAARARFFVAFLILLCMREAAVAQQKANPTSQPTRQPSRQPTRQPTRQPSSRPSRPSGAVPPHSSATPPPLLSNPSSLSSPSPSFPPLLCRATNVPAKWTTHLPTYERTNIAAEASFQSVRDHRRLRRFRGGDPLHGLHIARRCVPVGPAGRTEGTRVHAVFGRSLGLQLPAGT